MKKYSLLLINILFCFSITSFAQKENNVWIFGHKLGIDFNSAVPALVSSNIQSFETSTSVCDTSGKLLFYSNGLTVWDNTHTPMPNGTGLLGCDGGVGPGSIPASASLGVAIAPIIGFPNLYYLFTLQEQELFPYPTPFKGEFRYSIIDMSLNAGKGDIVSGKKNILIDSQMSERMTVVKADCGVWIVTHHNDKNTFYAYKVDSKDSVHKPIISDFSTISYARQYMVGQIKSSPDGTKIACATNGKNTIELFDFDKSTGVLSSLKLIETGTSSTYGVEFSMDNSKLYTLSINGYINQYDLSLLPTVSAVVASKYVVNSINRFNGIRLAPNGKIYVVATSALNQISIIHAPNLTGALCSLEINNPTLKNTNISPYMSFGNKTVSVDYLNTTTKIDTNICDTNKFVVVGSPSSSGYLWNDGDTSRVKILTTSGTYWRKSNNKCLAIADTFIVNFVSKTTTSTVFDTTICEGEFVRFSVDNSYSKILWNDLDTSRDRTLSKTGIYFRKSEKNCSIFIDTFKVTVRNIDTTQYMHDTIVCFTNNILVSAIVKADKYLWSDGTINRNNLINENELKWVYATHFSNCSVRIDSFHLTSVIFQSNINDTFICKDQEISIDATVTDATAYKWHNGATTNNFKINNAGQYWVQISIGDCTLTDSFLVVSKSLNLNLGGDKTICKGESYLLETKIKDAIYLWSNGDNTENLLVKEKGNYVVTVSKDGCTETDDINIDVVECDKCIFIPNAFTPNNDLKNDQFKPIFNCPIEQYEILIVNRYGQEVFRTNNSLEAWDGRFNNQNEQLGVYYYLIKVKFANPNAIEQIYKGDISLIR